MDAAYVRHARGGGRAADDSEPDLEFQDHDEVLDVSQEVLWRRRAAERVVHLGGDKDELLDKGCGGEGDGRCAGETRGRRGLGFACRAEEGVVELSFVARKCEGAAAGATNNTVGARVASESGRLKLAAGQLRVEADCARLDGVERDGGRDAGLAEFGSLLLVDPGPRGGVSDLWAHALGAVFGGGRHKRARAGGDFENPWSF